MFDTLLESRHTPLSLPRWGVAVAVGLHVAVVGAIVRPVPREEPPPVITAELPPLVEPSGPRKIADPGPVVGFPVDFRLPLLPPVPPIPGVPGLDPSPRAPVGDPGGPSTPFGVGDTAPWLPSLVQELPELLTAPVPPYPALLREAGVAGVVLVQVVVDTTGRPEPGSLRVVQSSNTGFDAAAVATIRSALFRPGRVWGRAVRVLVRVPVEFRLRPPS